jgi:hypothetical protein
VAGEVRGPSPAPSRAVATTRSARPLPVQRALYLHRATHTRRPVHGWLDWQRLLRKAKPAAAMPGGLSVTLFENCGKPISCDG